jgi:adhesin HecA-like repeat protein
VRNSGNLIAGQNIGVTGNRIDASGGGMSAQGAVSLAATGDVSTRGATVSGNGIAIQTTGALDNTAGQLYSNTNLQVGAQRVVNQGGLLAATNDATITTGSLDNTGGTLGTNTGNLSVSSTGTVANAGSKLIAGRDASAMFLKVALMNAVDTDEAAAVLGRRRSSHGDGGPPWDSSASWCDPYGGRGMPPTDAGCTGGMATGAAGARSVHRRRPDTCAVERPPWPARTAAVLALDLGQRSQILVGIAP